MSDPVLDQATDWLIRLNDRPPDPQLQARFEAWLDSDPRHGEVWTSLSDTYGLIHQTKPVDSVDRLVGPQVGARGRTWRPASQRPLVGLVAGIAAVLIGLFAGPTLLTALRADYRTGTAEMRTVRLDDGTTVHLGPETALRVAYTAQARDVELLSGDALFAVTHNPARPFRVRAGEVTATDLGTVFDIRRLKAATEVGVRQGRVGVSRAPNVAPAPLRAGDRLVTDGQSAQITHSAPALIAGWSDGRIMARDSTVSDVIEELRPWFAGRIVLASASTGSRRVNGVYDPHDPIAALRALLGQEQGKILRVTPWLIVVR